MRIEVTLPSMGEDAESEATVAFWSVEVGDRIGEGDDLVDLTTDKAAFTVPSPASGCIVERMIKEGDEVSVGDIICVIDTEA